jgi:nitrate reductase gamma subunit
MQTAYTIVSGPLAWLAFLVFFGGIVCRLIRLLIDVRRTEKWIFSYMSWKYSLRSIGRWLLPFGTVNWRRHPGLTVATFAFHLCLLLTPIFLLSHVVLWDEAFDLSWWTLPDALGDVMTVVVIVCCIYFLVRRLRTPEVKFVTSASDFVILVIVTAPFITGFLAYHQWFAYPVMVIAHIVSGEIMLVAIPFTRLSHMIFSPLTRAYMGSEFGKVRHARDW